MNIIKILLLLILTSSCISNIEDCCRFVKKVKDPAPTLIPMYNISIQPMICTDSLLNPAIIISPIVRSEESELEITTYLRQKVIKEENFILNIKFINGKGMSIKLKNQESHFLTEYEKAQLIQNKLSEMNIQFEKTTIHLKKNSFDEDYFMCVLSCFD